MKIRALVYLLMLVVAAFAAGSYLLSPLQVFHVLNSVAISAGIITIAAYTPAIYDIWARRQESVLPGHLLALGVTVNWVGFIARLGRWFFTNSEPAAGLDQWEYNVGLWISLLASAFLIGAVARTEPCWSARRVCMYIAMFVTLTMILWLLDYYYVPQA